MVSRRSDANKQYGNYRATKEIGHGGTSWVYKGRHIHLERTVAIKVLSPSAHFPLDDTILLHEAALLEKLKHPHIPEVFDVGFEDGAAYLVIEYASHGSLQQLLQRWTPYPLPLREAIAILVQVGETLHYAHQQHIIHRDLKPGNILFDSHGDVLLTDFGISFILSAATMELLPGIIGTPWYMAPEAFQGSVGRRSDQYSLACIVYEMFTGRCPFIDKDAKVLAYKHLNELPVPPTVRNPDLPQAVDEALLKALAKKPDDRYPTVLAFVQALQTAASPQINLATMHFPPAAGILEVAKESYLKEGLNYYFLEAYQEALFAFEKAIRFDPHYADAYVGKGKALHRLRRYEEALVAFDQATSYKRNYAHAHYSKSWTLLALGRRREAHLSYKLALQLDPKLAETNRKMSFLTPTNR